MEKYAWAVGSAPTDFSAPVRHLAISKCRAGHGSSASLKVCVRPSAARKTTAVGDKVGGWGGSLPSEKNAGMGNIFRAAITHRGAPAVNQGAGQGPIRRESPYG